MKLLSIFWMSTVLLQSFAGGYSGDKLLEILGEEKNGVACGKFRTEYLLDKSLKNFQNGIKLTTSHDSVSVVTAVTITAAGAELNDITYKDFKAALPFGVSLEDNEETLVQKIGKPSSSINDHSKFKKDGITMNVFFKSAAKKKIDYIKYTQNLGATGPYRLDAPHDILTVASIEKPAEVAPKSALKSEATNKAVSSLPEPASFSKSTNTAKNARSENVFFNSIMTVFESGEDVLFKDIKRNAMLTSNFWNYKHVYATSVKIPGEKYNMLYSFPFQNSQLDFVSVLEESDGYNKTMEDKYHEFETKLMENFKASDGWHYSYTKNEENPNGLKDFEMKNPKVGSVVLDYSVNPYKKHVLYLRFLLQYD